MVSVCPEEPVEVEVAVDDGEHVAVEQNLLGDHQLVLVLVEVHLVWVQTTLKETNEIWFYLILGFIDDSNIP